MVKLLGLLSAAWYAVSHVAAISSTGNSVLVVLDPKLKRDDYSAFFNGLKKRGYNLTFRAPKDVSPAIAEFDVPAFSHVILFAPNSKAFANDITPQSLVKLLAQGTNVLFALSSKSTPISSLATEFGLSLPPPNTPLISHFPSRPAPHTALPISLSQAHPLVTPNLPPILFSGVNFALNDNPRVFSILRAPVESFAADSEDDVNAETVAEMADRGGEGFWAGNSMSVVAGFQVAGGARAAWVGGVSVFSDEFAKAEVSPVNHRLASTPAHNATIAPTRYTVKDNVVYEIHVSKFDGQTGEWTPDSGIEDMQLDFTMLDPHIRVNLPGVKTEPGVYRVEFRAPDRHGVFKFIVDWRRKGYTYLESSTTVSVVPPRHDGYPRFLSAAWPYYVGAISTSVGFIAFCTLWLLGDNTQKVKGRRKVE
ncbi:Dolichyl-diphosphooligosaccharide--protein glycosyltransferase 48 kDa subunit [Rhizoctonia solani]|uniref:Dolichyl-diphosphooligosaccharide--protein glycosyltransferase subunit WBP1 n=1 Tax=Rhizoctonia solani TaxID=456999 RepID=A0A8H7I656_9AGAM|nr:Dolichyl-diphosphooligosaccharide--protein glycosyltransferase 48 kDa subunit [Rhizoctonia solani]